MQSLGTLSTEVGSLNVKLIPCTDFFGELYLFGEGLDLTLGGGFPKSDCCALGPVLALASGGPPLDGVRDATMRKSRDSSVPTSWPGSYLACTSGSVDFLST